MSLIRRIEDLFSCACGLGAGALTIYILEDYLFKNGIILRELPRYKRILFGLGEFGIMSTVDRKVNDTIFERLVEIEEYVKVFFDGMQEGAKKTQQIESDISTILKACDDTKMCIKDVTEKRKREDNEQR